jgi:hypothetical protein
MVEMDMRRRKNFGPVAVEVEVDLLVAEGEAEMKSRKAEVAMRKGRQDRMFRIHVLTLISLLVLSFALKTSQAFAEDPKYIEDGFNVYKVGQTSLDPLKVQKDRLAWINQRVDANDSADLLKTFETNPKELIAALSVHVGDTAALDTVNNTKKDPKLKADMSPLEQHFNLILSKVSDPKTKATLTALFKKLVNVYQKHPELFNNGAAKDPKDLKQIMADVLDDKDVKLADLGLTTTAPTPMAQPAHQGLPFNPNPVGGNQGPQQSTINPNAHIDGAGSRELGDGDDRDAEEDALDARDRARQKNEDRVRKAKQFARKLTQQCEAAAILEARANALEDDLKQEMNMLQEIALKASSPNNELTHPPKDDNFKNMLADLIKKKNEPEQQHPQPQQAKESGSGSGGQQASRREDPERQDPTIPQNPNMGMPPQQQQGMPFNPMAMSMMQPAPTPTVPKINADLPQLGNGDLIASDINRFASQLAMTPDRTSILRQSTNTATDAYARYRLVNAANLAESDLQTAQQKRQAGVAEMDRIRRDLSVAKRAALSPDLQTQRESLVDAVDKAQQAKQGAMMDPMVLMMASGPNGPDPMMMMMASKKANDTLTNAQAALKKFDAQTSDLLAQKNSRIAEMNEELTTLQQADSSLAQQINKLKADQGSLQTAAEEAYSDAKQYAQQQLYMAMNNANNTRYNSFTGPQQQNGRQQQQRPGPAQAMPSQVRQPLGRTSFRQSTSSVLDGGATSTN